MTSVNEWVIKYKERQTRAIESIDPAKIHKAIGVINNCRLKGGDIYIAGNGGSGCNSDHFMVDLLNNASHALIGDMQKFHGQSLHSNTAMVTANANDRCFKECFSRQVKDRLSANDVVIGVSVSGRSGNVCELILAGNEAAATTIFLTNDYEGNQGFIADLNIRVKDDHYGRVEDCHMMILHMLCYAFVEGVVS